MNGRYYIVRIILAMLLTFCTAGYIGVSAVMGVVGNTDTYYDIIEEKELSKKAYESLEKNFSDEYNTTLIPAEVYMNTLTEEWIEGEMRKDAAAFAEYVSKNAKSLAFSHDYTVLEKSITDFFYEYAESIDYEPDEAFETALTDAISKAESKINSKIDAFYIAELYENGTIAKAAPYISLLRKSVWILAGTCVLLAAILVLMDRKGGWRRLYFAGTGFFAGGALMLLTPAYLLFTDTISSFAIKDAVVYPAVTGLMEAANMGLLIKSLGFGFIGLVLIGITVVMNKKPQN